MKELKYILTFIIYLVIIGNVTSQEYLIDKIVAKVGSELILLSEVEDEYSFVKSQDKNITPDAKCEILKNLIIQKIIVYQAKLDSIEVSDDDVESQLNFRFESILQRMNGDEKFFEEYYGATVQQMKDRYRDDQRQKMLADKMQSVLINKVKITPKEVEAFYNSIPRDSIPYLSSEVEVGEIVISPEVNKVEKQKALDKIMEIKSRIEGGEDFGELAKKYSVDSESAKRGGDLGFAKRGVYVPEFESAVFTLKPGERSDIVETEFGFHYIELIERKGNSVHARHILISPEITDDDRELAKRKLDSIRTLILNDSITFEQAVKKYSKKEMPSYSNNGKLKNPNTGNNYFETQDLDPETYFAIDKLKVNELSKVTEIKDLKGEKMYRLLKLYSKSKPHQANLSTDYDKISTFAKESKKAEYFNSWLENKMAKINIKVDYLYSDCEALSKWITIE